MTNAAWFSAPYSGTDNENALASRTYWGGKEVPGYVPMRGELEELARYWAEELIYMDHFLELQVGNREFASVYYADRRLNMLADLLGADEVQKIFDEVKTKWESEKVHNMFFLQDKADFEKGIAYVFENLGEELEKQVISAYENDKSEFGRLLLQHGRLASPEETPKSAVPDIIAAIQKAVPDRFHSGAFLNAIVQLTAMTIVENAATPEEAREHAGNWGQALKDIVDRIIKAKPAA